MRIGKLSVWLGLACAAGWSGAGAAARSATERVVLIALDGAGSAAVARRIAAGELGADGLTRLIGPGRSARELDGLDPAVATPHWASVVTGVPAAVHGVWGALFRAPGIGRLPHPEPTAASRVETLWQAAQRQGKRVGAVGWPGIDGANPPRRTNWGLAQVAGPQEFAARYYNVSRSSMRQEHYGVGPGPAERWSLPKGVVTYSETWTTSIPMSRPHERADRIFDLIAIDTTDDGRTNFDSALVVDDINPSQGFLGVVRPGEWFHLALPGSTLAGERGAVRTAPLHLVRLDPEDATMEIYVADDGSTRAFPAPFQRQLQAANRLWPGTPDESSLADARLGRSGLSEELYVEQLRRATSFAIDVALDGLATQRTDLLLVHLEAIARADRELGLELASQPGYDAKTAARFAQLRRSVWQHVDREIARLVAGADPARTAFVLVGGPVAMPVDRQADLAAWIARAAEIPELAAVRPEGGRAPYGLWVEGAFAALRFDREKIASDRVEALASRLAKRLAAERIDGERVFASVLTRREASRVGLADPSGGDLFLFAAPRIELVRETGAVERIVAQTERYAVAGWRSGRTAPAGIYAESVPGASGHGRGDVAVTDVARRVARLLGIEPPSGRPVATP